MALVYRCFRTFCYHVLWPPRRVLVCMMGMLDRLCLSVSDILRVTLVACVQRTSRGSFAFARARLVTDQDDYGGPYGTARRCERDV